LAVDAPPHRSSLLPSCHGGSALSQSRFSPLFSRCPFPFAVICGVLRACVSYADATQPPLAPLPPPLAQPSPRTLLMPGSFMDPLNTFPRSFSALVAHRSAAALYRPPMEPPCRREGAPPRLDIRAPVIMAPGLPCSILPVVYLCFTPGSPVDRSSVTSTRLPVLRSGPVPPVPPQ